MCPDGSRKEAGERSASTIYFSAIASAADDVQHAAPVRARDDDQGRHAADDRLQQEAPAAGVDVRVDAGVHRTTPQSGGNWTVPAFRGICNGPDERASRTDTRGRLVRKSRSTEG